MEFYRALRIPFQVSTNNCQRWQAMLYLKKQKKQKKTKTRRAEIFYNHILLWSISNILLRYCFILPIFIILDFLSHLIELWVSSMFILWCVGGGDGGGGCVIEICEKWKIFSFPMCLWVVVLLLPRLYMNIYRKDYLETAKTLFEKTKKETNKQKQCSQNKPRTIQ